jgi:copper chaperone CopZ
MRISSIRFVVALALTMTVSVPGQEKPAPTPNATNQFTITGMTCNGCAKGLESELARAHGVVSAQVSLTNRLAIVISDTNFITAKGLKEVIVEAGFKAKAVSPSKVNKP